VVLLENFLEPQQAGKRDMQIAQESATATQGALAGVAE